MWNCIDNETPKDEVLLVYNVNNQDLNLSWYDNDDELWYTEQGIIEPPTHWKPIGELPE